MVDMTLIWNGVVDKENSRAREVIEIVQSGVAPRRAGDLPQQKHQQLKSTRTIMQYLHHETLSPQMPEYFDIRIPVITLRVILILLTTLTVSLGVLFPFSCLSFNFFYNYLIPTPTISLPLRDFVVNYDFPNLPPFVVFGKHHKSIYGNHPRNDVSSLFTELDPELHYDFDLKFQPACRSNEASTQPLMFKLTILSDSLLSHLSPYGLNHKFTKKHFSTWPLTNNIHMLDNPRVLISALNSFLLYCNRSTMELKSLFPPVFQFFLPPVLTEYQYLDGMQTLEMLKDIQLSEYLRADQHAFKFEEPWSIVLEFNKGSILIDPTEASLEINVSWKGLRYYLYHYRSLSYLIGVSILWSVSSVALFVTIGGLIMLREITGGEDMQKIDDDEANEEEPDTAQHLDKTKVVSPSTGNPITMKGDYERGFVGRTDSGIDFKVNVHESIVTD